ncbi:MAG TPA: hypothetical protein VFV63_14715 [Ilumatobacteraceae bacterium]|nr:hypothetical protein [Ilumatobacteraceae bacterium]
MKALIASLATFGAGMLAACGSSSPVEVVVEPGITAIRESSALACDADLESMLLAVEAYTMLEAESPAVESDLVPDFLRSESQLYDLVDGQIVPVVGSGCPIVPADATGTSAETAASDDPVRVSDCSARFKTLQVAIEAYYAMNGMSTVPTEQALVDAVLVRGLDDAFDVDANGQVVAVPGGRCDGVELPDATGTTLPTGPVILPDELRECEQERALLEVAMEAYFAVNGSAAASEADLVSADLLRSELGGYDIVDGAIVAAPDSICPPI